MKFFYSLALGLAAISLAGCSTPPGKTMTESELLSIANKTAVEATVAQFASYGVIRARDAKLDHYILFGAVVVTPTEIIFLTGNKETKAKTIDRVLEIADLKGVDCRRHGAGMQIQLLTTEELIFLELNKGEFVDKPAMMNVCEIVKRGGVSEWKSQATYFVDRGGALSESWSALETISIGSGKATPIKIPQ